MEGVAILLMLFGPCIVAVILSAAPFWPEE